MQQPSSPMSEHFSAAYLNSNGPSCATRVRQHLYQNFIPNSPASCASGTLDVCVNQRNSDNHNHCTPHSMLGPSDCSPSSIKWSNPGPWMSSIGSAPYHRGHRLSLANTGGHVSGEANNCAQRDLSGHSNTGSFPLPPKGYNDSNHCRSPILHHLNTIPSDSEFVPQSIHIPSMSSLCSPITDRPKMREPACLPAASSVTCKRNPPPPPPPRSGSWLGRTPADVIRQPHHIANVAAHHLHQQQQQPYRPCPSPLQNNQPRLCQQQNAVVSTSPGLQSVPSQAAHYRPFELKANHTMSNPTGSHASQLSSDSRVTQYPTFPLTTSITRQALPPQTAQFSNSIPAAHPSPDKVTDSDAIEQPALLPVRTEVTDRLLQLLIRHFSATPVNSVSAPVCPAKDKATLDRLLQTVCSSDSRRLSPSGLLRYVDSQVASVAQRILPHLVRIIYTELADRGTGLCENERNHFSNDIQPSDGESRFVRVNGVRGSAEPDLMTTSTESRLSCTEEDECGRENDDVEDTVLDVLDEGCNKPGFEGCTELDSLPVGTSIAELKNAAIEAIYRLVPLCQPDVNLCERDLGIVRLLATIHAYSSIQQARLVHLTEFRACKTNEPMDSLLVPPALRCPVAEVAALVRLSFYPEHRAAICNLGGVHALIALLRTEHAVWTKRGPVHSSTCASPILDAVSSTTVSAAGQSICTRADQQQSIGYIQTSHTGHLLETSIALRRYICMALTNLTFGVPENKALLCRRVTNLEALLAQVETSNEELKQVAASVLRNLCWRTDSRSKLALRRVNAPRRLTVAAMTSQRDSTLRTTLSALWNLSAHCSYNKRAVCGVNGVFPFLLGLLHCQDLANRVVIMENSGGILRNISVVIAGREDYRAVLQQNNCYPILIDLLRNAPSLTVVVNVCGTLWNLTAAPHCPAAELLVLCRLGVVDWLHQLAQSPHELVRNSSTAVLRNLMHPTSLQSDLSTCSSYCTASDIRSTDGLDTVRTTDQPVTSQDLPLSTHTHDLTKHDDTEDDDQKVTLVDQSYRRRSNARARLRFGLLSVVLEANDADEEAAAESEEDEEEEDDEETYGHDEDDDVSQTSIYPDQEALVTDESTELLRANATIIQSLPQVDTRRPLNMQSVSDCHSWNPSDNEDEQAYVYAEEGTPFPPDSTTASCLDLHQPRTLVELNRNGDQAAYCSLNHGCYDIAAHQPTTLTSYSFKEAVSQVHDMENTPLQLESVYPSVDGASSPRLICNEASVNALLREPSRQEAAHVNDEEADDEAPQLPSPPPDVSGLVSPLLSLQLDDDYANGLTTAFTLPPPPVCVTTLTTGSNVVVDESRNSSAVRSPLIFSRGSSSYLSSTDLGSLPAGFQSSPQSECSSQPMPHELEFPEGEGSSPRSHAVASHSDSAVEDECEPVEEEEGLAPLAFSNGDGVEEGNEGEEVKLAFAEEGTPQDAVSLLDEPSMNYVLHDRSFDYAFEKANHQPTVCAHWNNENVSNPVDRAMSLMVEDGDDEDEQGQTHILRQCIASAMPTNVSFALRPEVSNGLKFAASVSEGLLFAQTDDSVQAFAVEDTPFGTSTKTSSLSDLYSMGRKSPIHFTDCHLSSSGRRICNHKGDPTGPPDDHNLFACINHSSNSTRGIERDGSSNSSSLSGDTSSDLLSEVIQSAMPKSAQIGLLVSCAGPPDGDCLQLYAVEGTPGEDDLSESSSMQNMGSSDLNSSISQPSLQCSSTTSPPTTAQPHCLDTLQPNPPAPPRRTTSAVSLQKDPFAPTGPSVIRPQATVAPMPQVARCSPTTTEPSDILSVGSDTYELHKSPFTRETGVFNVVDKDDASSFSSLLSIESVGLEHNLLQECISSAMPRPKLSGPLRKHHPHHQLPLWHQLPSDMCSIEGIPLEQDETPLSNGPQVELEPNPNTVAQPAPTFHSGLPVPGAQLSSVESPSNVSVEPNSVSILVTDTTEPTKIACIPASSVAVPNTKRTDSKSEHRFGAAGAFHFLDCGSDGAHLLPRHSSPVTKNIMSVVPPDRGQLVAHETARKQLCDLGSSGARNLDEGKNIESCPSGISQLPVRTSRLPIMSNPLAVTNPAGSTRGRESPGPSVAELMVVEGAKTVLAALINGSSDGEPDELITAKSKLGSARVLPVAEGALPSKIKPLHATRPPASQIPSVSQSSVCSIPTRLVQPSRITKSSVSPQSGLLRSIQPKHVTNQPHTPRPSPSLVHGAQTTKTSIVSDKRNPNPTDSVASKPQRLSVSSSMHSKTVTSAKTALKFPAQHLLPGHRSALTCPSSATVRSPIASRSTSVSGSQTNLHSTTRGVPSSRPVSAHSVCAALARQDRAVSAVVGSNTALRSPTKRIQPTTPHHVYHQVSKTRTTLGSSASTRASLTILNPSDNDSHSTKFGFLSSTELNQLGSTSSNSPKPIRGGRKSLTGRKPSTIVKDPVESAKPVIRPTVHSTLSDVASIHLTNGLASISSRRSSSNPPVVNSTVIASKLLGTPSSAARVMPNGRNGSTIPPSDPRFKQPHAPTDQNRSMTDLGTDVNEAGGMWIVRGELAAMERVN